MRALLLFALFALATQVHMSEVTEFYRTFVDKIPTLDVEAKNRIMNDGLDCINWATNVIAHSVQNIETDLHSKDLISTLRHAIGSVQVFEDMVLPKCVQTYIELKSYFVEHQNIPHFDSARQRALFEAKAYQLLTKIVIDVLQTRSSRVAEDLAVFVSTGFGLMDANLPEILDSDYDKYVPMDKQKYVPEFFKGFFTGIGITDLAKINATAQCALDVSTTLNTVFMNHALQRGDFSTRAHAFLDSFMTVTDAFERCKRLDMIDTVVFQKLIQNFKQHPFLSLFVINANALLNLPDVIASENNMAVLINQGQYELAGRVYAKTVRAVYDRVMF